jgi:putative endonuclease
MWHVYLILCGDSSIYTGITNNLKQRFQHHKNGKGGHYTRSHKVVRMLYSEQFQTRSKALRREAQIKNWRRKRKLNLIKFGKSISK